jgi:hypothetical protein
MTSVDDVLKRRISNAQALLCILASEEKIIVIHHRQAPI